MQMTAVGRRDRLTGAEAPPNRERRIDNRKRERDQRHEQAHGNRNFRSDNNRHRREDVSDEERTGVAQDNLRRIEVVRKNTERSADQRRKGERWDEMTVTDGDREQEQSRDRRDAGQQPVESVEKVERGHHAETI